MRVILAPIRAASLALRNPDALVIDFENQCIRRGSDRAMLGVGAKRTQTFRICAALCCAVDGQVWRSELLALLYADNPEGGPTRARNVLAQVLFRIKPFLSWAGLRIVCERSGRIEVVATALPIHSRSFRIGFRTVGAVGVAA